VKLAFGVLAAVISFAACFVLGFSWRDIREGKLPEAPVMKAILAGEVKPVEKVPAKTIFKDAYGAILKDYYKPIDRNELKYAGMQGLMASLGDPHTMFLPPRDAKDFQIETSGNFVGIGARLSPDPMGALVVVVFKDGPAWRAGIRKGDTIIAVDDSPSAGKKVSDLVDKIRGKAGTPVKLKLSRPGEKEPYTVTVRRAQVTTPTVDYDMVPNTKIGYISISGFAEPTTEQFDEALDALDKAGAKALVIDLRNNGGGLLQTARDMLSRFVEDKVFVKLKMKDKSVEAERTLVGLKRPKIKPIVVLVNENSASASEIFCGVLSDYKLATVVGEHTYGKNSVQNVWGLNGGSSAKVTIAKYFIPSGRDFARRVDEDGIYISGGLIPDFEVKYENLNAKPGEVSVVPTDSQMRKAVEILQAKIG
jgi:carboxyl-terminal processing protease